MEKFYPVMRGFAEFMIANTGHKSKKAAKETTYNKYVYEKGMHLGEWLESEEFQDKIAAGHSALHTEEATAYLHYTMRHMVEAAQALGKTPGISDRHGLSLHAPCFGDSYQSGAGGSGLQNAGK